MGRQQLKGDSTRKVRCDHSATGQPGRQHSPPYQAPGPFVSTLNPHPDHAHLVVRFLSREGEAWPSATTSDKVIKRSVTLWTVTDQISGKRRQTRYRMTEADARTQFGDDAQKVEGSLEVRTGEQ